MQVSARDIIYNTYTPVGFISNTYSHSLSFGMLSECVYSQQNLSISRIAVCDMMNVNCKYYALNLIVAVCWEKNFPATFHKVRRGMKENEIPWRKLCAHKTLPEDCEGGRTKGATEVGMSFCAHDFFIATSVSTFDREICSFSLYFVAIASAEKPKIANEALLSTFHH